MLLICSYKLLSFDSKMIRLIYIDYKFGKLKIAIIAQGVVIRRMTKVSPLRRTTDFVTAEFIPANLSHPLRNGLYFFSYPIVVFGPCPGYTTVSLGNTNK